MSELVVRIKYSPHTKQRYFHDSKHKFRALVGGVGSGKSLGGVMEVLKMAVQYPGSSWAIVAPSYRMLKDATLQSFEEFCPKELIAQHIRGEKKFILVNGSEIWYRSADDPESLRGPNLHGFFMDEAALCRRNAWLIMIGRIRRKGAPNCAWVATTPKGFNWVYQLFVKDQNPDYSVVYATSYENPHLPPDFADSLKRSYSGTFYEQEVLGQFRAHEGVVYREFNRAVHEVSLVSRKEAYVSANHFIGGIDWGYANPMVALVIALDGDQRLHIAEEVYRSRMTIEEFSDRIHEAESRVKERLGLETISVSYFADPSDVGLGTGSLADQLRQRGHVIQKANNTVMTGINAVMSRLHDAGDGLPRLFVDPCCVHTLAEFEQYSFEDPDDSKPSRDKPVKQNDHAMDSMRYAVMSLQTGDRVVALGGGDLLF